MKEIVIRTLADLGPGVGLYGYCEACGRMERLERKALIRALGWDAELERIRRGLRCGECGRPAILWSPVGSEQARGAPGHKHGN